jgi:hypothetical protein
MRELKNLETTLQGHGIGNFTHVQVCLGTPTSEGTVELVFHEIVFNKGADTNEPTFDRVN